MRFDFQPALFWNIGASVAVALAVNAIVFGLGWDRANDAQAQPPLAPPGVIVGIVWIVLFGAMGAARYAVVASGRRTARRDAWALVALIAFCAVYPLYTRGLADLRIATLGNLATLAAALVVAALVRRDSPRAVYLILPVAAWVSFATYLTVGTILRNS